MAKKTKARINKWEYIKIKYLLLCKRRSHKTNRKQSGDWEIFAHHTFDKGLISKIYKTQNSNKTESKLP